MLEADLARRDGELGPTGRQPATLPSTPAGCPRDAVGHLVRAPICRCSQLVPSFHCSMISDGRLFGSKYTQANSTSLLATGSVVVAR